MLDLVLDVMIGSTSVIESLVFAIEHEDDERLRELELGATIGVLI